MEAKVYLLDLSHEPDGWIWNPDDKPPYDFPGLKDVRYKRRGHSATLIGDKVFLFGGEEGTYDFKNDLQVFDTTTWTIKEWHYSIGKKPSPRYSHGATSIDENIFIFGGFEGS